MTVTTSNTTWSSVYTWSAGEQLTASKFNTHLRDKFTALKTPAHGYSILNEASDYTTTSTSFTDIDATDLALTVTVGPGKILVGFSATVANSTAGNSAGVTLELLVDGVAVGGDDGILKVASPAAAAQVCIAFTRILPAPGAGSHTFKLQWKVGAGTATMFSGAGTSGADLHPQFWVLEAA